jgi:hypothetical protein
VDRKFAASTGTEVCFINERKRVFGRCDRTLLYM